MATWLFRGNPRDFDVNAYLQAHRDIRWFVHQQLLIPEMHLGDPVYIWRSDGGFPGTGGIVAHGFLSGPAVVRLDRNFVTWLRKEPNISIPTVLIRLDDIRLTPRSGCLLRTEILQDATLRNLHAISMPSVTNYKLTAVEDARLAQVWEARRLRDL
ncbi:hypothetical protein [Candidatus Cryosericum terrychapinii]|uniref:EVE domain-containing protein n=1 Tax=Candidatus Cryosericum terrychapinii TaxID=2290919 RepID=A0A398CZB5_9BACT|nr:hypothetical protein [Candidatus Cryosericum terrychapinii]RIE06609.1 hypothetical protein SMC7_00955 [Candidatus Cryosericum terrychapinii]